MLYKLSAFKEKTYLSEEVIHTIPFFRIRRVLTAGLKSIKALLTTLEVKYLDPYIANRFNYAEDYCALDKDYVPIDYQQDINNIIDLIQNNPFIDKLVLVNQVAQLVCNWMDFPKVAIYLYDQSDQTITMDAIATKEGRYPFYYGKKLAKIAQKTGLNTLKIIQEGSPKTAIFIALETGRLYYEPDNDAPSIPVNRKIETYLAKVGDPAGPETSKNAGLGIPFINAKTRKSTGIATIALEDTDKANLQERVPFFYAFGALAASILDPEMEPYTRIQEISLSLNNLLNLKLTEKHQALVQKEQQLQERAMELDDSQKNNHSLMEKLEEIERRAQVQASIAIHSINTGLGLEATTRERMQHYLQLFHFYFQPNTMGALRLQLQNALNLELTKIEQWIEQEIMKNNSTPESILKSLLIHIAEYRGETPESSTYQNSELQGILKTLIQKRIFNTVLAYEKQNSLQNVKNIEYYKDYLEWQRGRTKLELKEPSSLKDVYTSVRNALLSATLLDASVSFALLNYAGHDLTIPLRDFCIGRDVLTQLIKDSLQAFKQSSLLHGVINEKEFQSLKKSIASVFFLPLLKPKEDNLYVPHKSFQKIYIQNFATVLPTSLKNILLITLAQCTQFENPDGSIDYPIFHAIVEGSSNSLAIKKLLRKTVLEQHITQTIENLAKEHKLSIEPDTQIQLVKAIDRCLSSQRILWLEILSDNPDGTHQFNYRDNGPGIPDDYVIPLSLHQSQQSIIKNIIKDYYPTSSWAALTAPPIEIEKTLPPKITPEERLSINSLLANAIPRHEAIFSGTFSTSPYEGKERGKGCLSIRECFNVIFGSVKIVPQGNSGVLFHFEFPEHPGLSSKEKAQNNKTIVSIPNIWNPEKTQQILGSCILIVEDNEQILSFEKNILNQNNPGVQLITARDIDAAKKLIYQERPSLILLDIVLDNNTIGSDLLLEMTRGTLPQIPTIIVSGSIGTVEALAALQLHPAYTGIYEKPILDPFDFYTKVYTTLATIKQESLRDPS